MNPTSRVHVRPVLARARRADVPDPGRGLRDRVLGLARTRGFGRSDRILTVPCDSFPVSSTRTTARSDASSRWSTRRTRSKPNSRRCPTSRSAPSSPRSATRSTRWPQPDEPSEDELHHEDLERRRELRKERRKRENERLQKALDDVLPEVFAMAREAMKRTLGMRHFDVQLIGGAVLHQGRIAEMRTGEGKTLVAAAGRDPQLADRPRRPHRDRQRLPRPARPAVDGPDLPLPRRQRRDDHPRRVVRLRARTTRPPTSG